MRCSMTDHEPRSKQLNLQTLVASTLLATLLLGCARNPPAPSQARAPHAVAAEAQAATSADELLAPGDEPCTENCAGHEAGYQWAEQKGIVDPNDCGGDSDSFVEGCMAYTGEQRQDRDAQDE